MRLLRNLLIGAALLGALVYAPPATAQQFQSAPDFVRARLLPIDGSGINAQVMIFETGLGYLEVRGWSSGMDPGVSFVTLLYDTRIFRGPNACVPIIRNPNMLVAAWTVGIDGIGILQGAIAGSLDDFRTVSIRLNPPAPIPGNLQACGRIIDRPFPFPVM